MAIGYASLPSSPEREMQTPSLITHSTHSNFDQFAHQNVPNKISIIPNQFTQFTTLHWHSIDARKSPNSKFYPIPAYTMYNPSFHAFSPKFKIQQYQNSQPLISIIYIGLEPKSSHRIKYSQPLELVLFHVTLNHN